MQVQGASRTEREREVLWAAFSFVQDTYSEVRKQNNLQLASSEREQSDEQTQCRKTLLEAELIVARVTGQLMSPGMLVGISERYCKIARPPLAIIGWTNTS